MNPFEDIKPPSDINWYRTVTLLATSSALAASVTHPVDIVRVQMQSQFQYISPRQVLKKIVKYRGIFGVYYGLVSTLQREFTYCWLRFAFYEHARSRGVVDSFSRNIQYASASGLIGGIITTPLTKIAIRIRADAAKSPKSRYNYPHVIYGLRDLYNEGGFYGCYNMVRTCGLRGMFTTVWQLAIFDLVRDSIINPEDEFHEWQRYLVSTAVAGTITVIALTPLDIVEQIGSTLHLNNFYGEWCIIRHIAQLHGFRGFYRGLLPNIIKVAGQTILTFLTYEQLNPKIPKLS